MKIILIAAVSRLGRIGDVVEVKNGYAKNFLIPNKKAICFTPANQKIFDARKSEFEQENQKGFDAASKLKAKIEGKNIVIIENASDDGRLYGSVNSLVIATKVNDMVGEKALSRADIFLKKPIKEIGVFEVGLNFHSDVVVNAKLIVTRSESEVEGLLKAEKGEKKSAKAEVKSDAENAEEKSAKPKKSRKKKEEAVEEKVVAAAE